MPSAVSTPERKVPLKHNHPQSPVNSKLSDDTASTAADTASTASLQQPRLYAPPVDNVRVDKRNVRQRLRDQEAKITALLNKPSPATSTPAASEDVLLTLVQTLEADLKKNQDEKQELQQALESLQQQGNSTKEKDTAEALSTQTDEEIMAVRMAHLEVELRHKTHEVTLLQDRWETTLRRMVGYQVDLETHELHYTDYAAQQFQAGAETLAELKDLTRKDQPEANRQLGKKAKHMMSTLLKDLEVLGERYKDSRVNQEQQVADLKIAQLEWRRRAEYLEAICKEQDVTVEEDPTRPSSIMSGPLMKFHQKLRLQQTAAMQTHKELQSQVEASQQQTEQAQLQREVVEKEVQRLKQTVSQLEHATRQQQKALHTAQNVAQEAVHRAANPPKKKKGWFRKPAKAPALTPLPPVPEVDVTAALAPLQGESKRFDILHERMQAQSGVLQLLQEDYKRVARIKNKLQQTVTELRTEQEEEKATLENRALQELQSKLDQVEAQRVQEQKQAQAEIQELRARLAAVESTTE